MTDSPPLSATAEPVLVELAPDLEAWTTPERFELFSEVQFIHHEIFEDRCYLRGGITLPDAPTIVDVGANIGLFTLFMTRERPAARVLAFEPMPDTLAALRRNVETHGLSGVTVLPYALGTAREDGVRFTFYPRLPGNSTRYPEDKAIGEEQSIEMIGREAHERAMEAREVEVDVRRFSEVVPAALAEAGADGTIDLLKVDVEGAELDVLAGLDDADWARVSQVVVEVQDLHGRLDAVTGLLRSQGFTLAVETQDEMSPEFRYSMVVGRRDVPSPR
jgi:FkbM family methyltransferase